MTAEPLKPLPCPWCQKPPTIRNVFNMFGMVESVNVYCPEHTHGFKGKTQQEAIAAWNRRVRPDITSIDSVSLMAESVRRGLAEVESSDIPDWLVRRIKNVTYGYKHAGDGWGYRDGYNDAMKWILSLRREDAE